MNEEALEIIGQLTVETFRLRKVAAQLQEALKLKNQEHERLLESIKSKAHESNDS